jgi:hypothetical protein
MSSIPIVQGVSVSPHRHNQHHHHDDGGGYYQQAPKPEEGGYGNPVVVEDPVGPASEGGGGRHFRDVIWAVLFVAHLVAVLVLIAAGMSSVDLSQGSDYSQVIFLVSVTAFAAVVLSTFALSWMMSNTETLVQMALVFSVLSSLAVGIVGFVMGSILLGCLGLLSFAVGICYAKLVWNRIPFAAANLRTALTAVRANLGVVVLAYLMLALAFGWTILWFLGVGSSLQASNLTVVFLLFVSYYWVHEVLQNVMQVTTAGVIGSWWFVTEEANSFCSKAVGDSFFRATTYSFGSICLGSLLVALVKALRSLDYYTRENDDFQFLHCIIQCLLGCLESILEEINKWAYVYVGLYGFGFLEAGRNVIQLFQHKGWSVIITDDLCDNVLFMMSVAIAMGTGLIGLVFGLIDPNMLADILGEDGGGSAAMAGFLIGGLVGLLFSAVLFSVVGSAVNTVIVCFCEAPAELEQNHPHLSAEMRASWTQAWPQLF